MQAKENHSTPKENFEANGFYLHKNQFPADQATAAAEWLRSQDLSAMAKTWTDQEPGVQLAVWQNVHPLQNPVATIANDSSMLKFAGDLLDQEIYIWSSKVNLKAAWCGTAEYYHQDYVYWKDRGYKNDDMMACMVFLDPHNVHNGGLHVLAGTHKLGFIDHEPFINTNGLNKYMIPPERMDQLHKDHELIAIDAQPGDVLFFHTGLVHGSAHNISSQPRMILLSQLNSKENKPTDVHNSAREFNIKRCEVELAEAERRYDYFKAKYEQQVGSQDITFNSPIPKEELDQ